MPEETQLQPLPKRNVRAPCLTSPPQPPSIHHQYMPMHIIASRRRQKYRGPANVPGLSPPPRRYPLQNLPVTPLIVPQRRRIVRRHIPRRNGVHVDLLRRPFVRQRPRQLRNSPFSRRIRRNQNPALKRKYRSNIHNLPRPPLRKHPLRSKLREPEHRRQVHGQNLIPVLHRGFRRRCPPDNPRIVHQNIDRPQLPHRPLNQLLANCPIRNIPSHINRLPAQPSNLVANAPTIPRPPMTHHIGPSPSQRHGNRRPNPTVRPSNHRPLPIQPKRIRAHNLPIFIELSPQTL